MMIGWRHGHHAGNRLDDRAAWTWAAFIAFVVAVLLLDLFVLHRRAQHVSLAEAAAWSAVWIAVGLGPGGHRHQRAVPPRRRRGRL
jgi:uncharacterized membrane protein